MREDGAEQRAARALARGASAGEDGDARELARSGRAARRSRAGRPRTPRRRCANGGCGAGIACLITTLPGRARARRPRARFSPTRDATQRQLDERRTRRGRRPQSGPRHQSSTSSAASSGEHESRAHERDAARSFTRRPRTPFERLLVDALEPAARCRPTSSAPRRARASRSAIATRALARRRAGSSIASASAAASPGGTLTPSLAASSTSR